MHSVKSPRVVPKNLMRFKTNLQIIENDYAQYVSAKSKQTKGIEEYYDEKQNEKKSYGLYKAFVWFAYFINFFQK